MQDTLSKTVSRRYYHSSSFKMAALFTLLLGAAALLLIFYVQDFSQQNFTRETEAAIDSEIKQIVAVYGDDQEAIQDYILKQIHSYGYPLYLYKDKKDEIILSNLQKIPATFTILKEGLLGFEVKIKKKNRKVAAKIHTFPNGSTLLIARDIHDIIRGYDTLKLYSILIVTFMMLVVCISFVISTFVVSRINRIAQTAQNIMDTGDLSKRISISSRWDDLSNLAYILNALLDKIEILMQSVRDVSDNIAHELKTPITRLRGELEQLQNKKLHHTDITRLVKEADNIVHIFQALLRITNIEKGKQYQAFEQLELSAILYDVIELYQPLADEKHIAIHTHIAEKSNIMGDKNLLFQMFANVMDNAIKFSAEGGNIYVKLAHHDAAIIVSITDEGVGVAPEEYDKIFSRFYRSQAVETIQGSGLGLAMVKAVADLHHITIALKAQHPGLELAFTIPLKKKN